MLAQTFMTAEELAIPQDRLDALIKVLAMLEREELRHTNRRNKIGQYTVCKKKGNYKGGNFNMGVWNCGSVRCIGGTAEWVGKFKFDERFVFSNHIDPQLNPQFTVEGSVELANLFYPDVECQLDQITASEAASALRNYLTMGRPCWREVLGEKRVLIPTTSSLPF